jgi:phosphonate metabolism protein (transferase hexapeptide repeat family)
MWIENHGSTVKPAALGEAPSLHPSAHVNHCEIGAWTSIGAESKLNNVTFGDWSYCTERCDIINAEIGKFCSIAAHVRINPGNHPIWRSSQHHFMYRASSYQLGEDEEWVFDWRRENKVTVGHDVWIGHGAIILAGVSVGTGAVVGAGAVVSKNVEPYTIVGGIPARTIRRRHEEDLARRLEDLAWWDWSHERMKSALEDFRNLSAIEFVEKFAGS